MSNTTLSLLLLLVYLASIVRTISWINLAYYHEKGRWRNRVPGQADIFMVATPFVNTLFAATTFMESWKDSD